MKNVFFVILICFCFGCKKEKENDIVTGTVIQQGGCFLDSWLIAIDNPDPLVHSFICDGPIPGGGAGYHCGNSVYIMSMPPNLRNPGMKVKFSKWKMDLGGACAAFSHASHHLEDSDIYAK